MDNYIENHSFLARWVSGELTPEELQEFKASKDYPIFKKINDVSQTLATPSYNKQLQLTKLKEALTRRTKHKKTAVKRIPNWAYAAAAILILAFGVFYAINLESKFKTGYGEKLAIVLPDNSKVHLNANSHLDYKNINWKKNRTLNLIGEAYFDVEKGQTFKVLTNQGTVEVLGTEFNVVSRAQYFEVQCMEGQVKVMDASSNKTIFLSPGNALRAYNNTIEQWNFALNDPNWLLGESTFTNTPITQVLTALENQYQITFDTSYIDLNQRFTGGFTHNDLNTALKTVTAPMNFTYQYHSETKVVELHLNK